MCHIVGKKIIQTYHYEIFVKWRRETSIVSWIITLLSEYCWKFSPKQMHMHNYNFCSPACYHCSCQSKKNEHNISSKVISLAYMWCSVWLCSPQDTCHLQSRQPAASTIWPFLDLGSALRELLIHRTCLSSSPILHFFCIFRASQLITEWSTW